MITKYGLMALALVLLWVLFLRPTRGGGSQPDRDRSAAPPPPRPTEMARCPGCGVYKLPGGNCNCTPSPASQD